MGLRCTLQSFYQRLLLLTILLLSVSVFCSACGGSEANTQTQTAPTRSSEQTIMRIPGHGGEQEATNTPDTSATLATPNAPDILTTMKKEADNALKTLGDGIEQLGQRGKDTTAYTRHLDEARTTLSNAHSPQDYVAFFVQIRSDIASLQTDLAGGNANVMLEGYLKEAQTWGDTHAYHNSYDGKDYLLNVGYLELSQSYGNGSYLRDEVLHSNPKAIADITDGNFLHAMLEANYHDSTPCQQAHLTDSKLLEHYQLQNDFVLVVSLTEQCLRIYKQGQLMEAHQVTTGRYDRPTPPGLFTMGLHHYGITLSSYEQPGSPDYYDPIRVNYAIGFWEENGYLIHDSWWRKDYGPGTQLPHKDSGGDPAANTGSHGCINLPTDVLKRLDPMITTATKLLIY